MTPWLLVMFIIVTPAQPTQFLSLSTRTEKGCIERQAEYLKHLQAKPVLVFARCVYMMPLIGSI